MSGVEALVVAFGLFLGYWVVAKLLGDKPASDAPEWHRTLQVPADASIEEIRAAYRSLMGQHQRRAQIERGCRCLPERHAGARSGRVSTLAALLFAGKFGKFLLSGGSMVLSVFAYALVYGWRYAAGFVGLIFVHEMGHFLAARKRELDVGLPTFIPFVGAWIELKEQPMDAETEAFVGIAGPMLGSAAAFACYILAREWGNNLLMALAYAGFVLNLFNLIPLSPLDGGRIVSVVSPRLWFFGVPILVALFFWIPSPMLVLVAVLALPQLWKAFQERSIAESTYYRVAPSVRREYAFQYLALAGFLAVMAFVAHEAVPRH